MIKNVHGAQLTTKSKNQMTHLGNIHLFQTEFIKNTNNPQMNNTKYSFLVGANSSHIVLNVYFLFFFYVSRNFSIEEN